MTALGTNGDALAGALRESVAREEALRAAAARFRRRRALEQLAAMGRAGDFDALLDKRAYRA
jgi:hypothetical protein